MRNQLNTTLEELDTFAVKQEKRLNSELITESFYFNEVNDEKLSNDK